MRVAAVRTTGIYCRPSCGASPNPANVHAFALAAAAEAAGYRACLRCRPYRDRQEIGWDAPELVCRAVRLILAGALDADGETALARRLGISARHLRRLFALHVGVSPDGLARSARAHFARRLLDDTDLPITQIAFAGGFGSPRQFNRVCKEIFRASPSELRARRRRDDRLVADGGLPLRLSYRGVRDWQSTLEYLRERAIPGVEAVDGLRYRRTIVVDGDPAVLEISPGGSDYLLLTAHLSHWDGLIHVVERARRIANLDFPLAEAVASVENDARLRHTIAAHPGRVPPGCWDPFEVGVWAILVSHGDLASARAGMASIADRLGVAVPGLGAWDLERAFPAAPVLAAAKLDEVGFARAAARAVSAFARAVAGGELPLDGSLALDDFVGRVAQIGGVGPAVGQYIAYRSGDRDAWPDMRLLSPGDNAEAEIADQAEQSWRPFRALGAVYAVEQRRGLRAA